MMKRMIGMIGGAVLGASLIVSPAAAVGASNAGDSAQVEELMRLTGYSSISDAERAEFTAELENAARSEGLPVEEVLNLGIAEARESLDTVNQDAGHSEGISTMSGKCGTKRVVGNATRTGDVFYSPASTKGIKHGHSGIYYRTHTVVEAPGKEYLSRSISAKRLEVCDKTQKQHVALSYSKRKSAGDRAFNEYRGKEYDKNWAFNKSNGAGKVNCSELVWRAYKYSTAKADLDYNGGAAVYPSNIRKSNLTSTYKTL